MGIRSAAVLIAAAVLAAPAAAGVIQGKLDCGSSCADYVIYVEGVPGATGTGDSEVTFDQKDKVFVPHVLPIVQGTTVKIANSDPFLHNVHAYRGKDTFFNIALPFQGQVMEKVFEEPGTYPILCDAHAEMSAFIVVLPNVFFTQPDVGGTFEITDVPTGSYTLVSLNPETKKEVKKAVTVGEGATQVSF